MRDVFACMHVEVKVEVKVEKEEEEDSLPVKLST